METNIVEFIQKYYVIEKRVGDIYLRDIFDVGNKESYVIDITPNVKFFWGRAKNVTGLNLYLKEYNHLPKIIREVFRSKKTVDFYSFIKEEEGDFVIPIKYIKDEFPNLYGEQVQRIISENTTNNQV
jgi:hypothetical protein